MAFINSDGTEAMKDMGQLGIEADGSTAGVQAVSLKEGLGRRACRLGGGGQADSTGALITINNASPTQLCQTAAAGAGLRHHATLITMMLVGGAVGTDWAFFSIAWTQDDGAAPFAEARRQLGEYFAGRRTTFDLPLAPVGTAFQRRVWEELRHIPHGETVSYGELARRIGSPTSCRAVGMANGRNPFSIIVPCHRVVGANGKLVGYAGGMPRKEALLRLETHPAASGDPPETGGWAEKVVEGFSGMSGE